MYHPACWDVRCRPATLPGVETEIDVVIISEATLVQQPDVVEDFAPDDHADQSSITVAVFLL